MHKFVIQQLLAARGNWQAVAKDSRVSYHTIWKIANKTTKNPGVVHIEKLNRYFHKKLAA